MRFRRQRLRLGDEGTALVLVALMMVVLIGFISLVVDVGRLSLIKRNLVAAADAAALAGAQEYARTILSDGTPEAAATAAVISAREYAGKNGLSDSEISVTVNTSARAVYVDVTRDVNLGFAPVMGIDKGRREAHAVAVTGPLAAGVRVVPVFVPLFAATPEAGDVFELKDGASKAEYGFSEFGCLNLSSEEDKSQRKKDYEEYLKWGYPGTISIYQYIDVLPGNNSSFTSRAIETDTDARLKRCSGTCAWNNYEPGCSRVVIVPVCDTSGLNPSGKDKEKGGTGPEDKKEVQVLGFATFFITDYGPDNTDDGRRNIVAIAAGQLHTVGFEEDGAVLATGDHAKEISAWSGENKNGGGGEGQDTLQTVFIKSITEGEAGGPGTPDFGTWAVNLVE